MSKKIDLGVEKDHIESLTRASGITAMAELIWNALDADSTEIDIEYNKNRLDGIERITVSDNGHGIKYQKAQEVFGTLGGSEKKLASKSPNGRYYHGKEGKGRCKSLPRETSSCFNGAESNPAQPNCQSRSLSPTTERHRRWGSSHRFRLLFRGS